MELVDWPQDESLFDQFDHPIFDGGKLQARLIGQLPIFHTASAFTVEATTNQSFKDNLPGRVQIRKRQDPMRELGVSALTVLNGCISAEYAQRGRRRLLGHLSDSRLKRAGFGRDGPR